MLLIFGLMISTVITPFGIVGVAGQSRPGGRGPRSQPAAAYGIQRSETGPDARMTCWKVGGGRVFEHVPPDLAPTARMLSW
jgi:hypothetical protein